MTNPKPTTWHPSMGTRLADHITFRSMSRHDDLPPEADTDERYQAWLDEKRDYERDQAADWLAEQREDSP